MGTSAVPSKRAGQLTGWAAACAAAQCCCQRGWASPTQGVVRPLYQWRTARPHAYSQSALNCADDDDALFGAGPAHGAAPLKARLGHDNFLLDHLGDGFDLLYFSAAAAAAGPVASGRCRQTLADADGPLRQRCGVQHSGAACLRRPDQHVCARWLTLDACRLQAAQATALPHRTPLMTTIDPNHALPGLSVTGMETVYDTLASAIDQAGPAETALLLVKLALLQARALGQALGQASSFQAQVQAALQGL